MENSDPPRAFRGFGCLDSKAKTEKGSLLRSSMFYPELPPF